MDPASWIMGLSCAVSCMHWLPGTPTYIHVVPRPGSAAERRGERPRVFDAPPAFVFHHANAFEEEQEDGGVSLVVDSVYYATLPAIGGKKGLERTSADADALFGAKYVVCGFVGRVGGDRVMWGSVKQSASVHAFREHIFHMASNVILYNVSVLKWTGHMLLLLVCARVAVI
jgi:hypothetical protein